MTEPIKAELKEELQEIAEGEDEATPARLLLGVATIVWVAAGVLIAVLLLVSWLVAR